MVRSGRPTALVFNPYLMTLGGGERYILMLAEQLQRRMEVTVAAPAIPSRASLESRGFPADLNFLVLDTCDFTAASAAYDVSVFLTNHLPQRSLARNSYLVVQFPFEPLPRRWHLRKRRRALHTLASWQCLVYSEYCRHWLRQRWLQPSALLPPAVATPPPSAPDKAPIILSVGRFFKGEHTKRQEDLIAAYRQLPKRIRSRWTLVLAGGAGTSRQEKAYVRRLRRLAARTGGIEVRTNVPVAELIDLYARASCFWHAAGYRRRLRHPGNAEHFGTVTVEAMSHGVVPIVYADGGQTEIVTPDVGRQWRTLDQLATFTTELIDDTATRAQLSTAARRRAGDFGTERFASRVDEQIISA